MSPGQTHTFKGIIHLELGIYLASFFSYLYVTFLLVCQGLPEPWED
jgi:hypothetical protein